MSRARLYRLGLEARRAGGAEVWGSCGAGEQGKRTWAGICPQAQEESAGMWMAKKQSQAKGLMFRVAGPPGGKSACG